MVRSTERPTMTIAVDLGHKATKQTNKQNNLIVPQNAFYQNCTNGLAPPNTGAARTLDKNIFKPPRALLFTQIIPTFSKFLSLPFC